MYNLEFFQFNYMFVFLFVNVSSSKINPVNENRSCEGEETEGEWSFQRC